MDLGKVFKIKIRHDNSMLSPAWFLDRVEVVDVAEKETYTFYCERWLGKNKDDGKIERSLFVKVSTGDYFCGRSTGNSCVNFDQYHKSLVDDCFIESE